MSKRDHESARGLDPPVALCEEERISKKHARGPHQAGARGVNEPRNQDSWELYATFRPDGITKTITLPEHVKSAAELQSLLREVAEWNENHVALVFHNDKQVRHVRPPCCKFKIV